MTDLLPVMPRYEGYKDSGVEWIGEIPKDWNIEKIKYLFKIGRGRVISQEELEEFGLYPVYSSQTKDGGLLGFINSYDYNCKQITWTTDGANAGTVFLREGKYNCTNVCGTLQAFSKNLSMEYLSFALGVGTLFYKRPDTNGAKIMNGEMAEIKVPSPPFQEQTTIANFLNCKTAKIDQAVAIKEKQIRLLKERKQILIQTAVTKGLEPNVPMADSGVEWIGEIPAHWGVVTLKRVALFIQTGPFGAELHTHDYVENGTPLINPKHMNEGNILPDPSCSVDDSTKERLNKYALVENDLILARRGEMGRAAVITTKEAGWLCGTGSIIIRLKQRTFNSHFLFRLISDIGFIETLKLDSVGSTMDNINSSIVGNLVFPIPPYQEQNQIVSHIETQSAKIDRAIAIQAQMIEKLKEYKATLINAAVTGKIKVPDGRE
ncbi:restriction endonuclease subunit S [Desulfobacter postgatei]|uniref:restriction endonuclease subunit S n=1 Tax=Desulfobacter postgatei TaxID=2293 RepID=UPI00259B402C|nr:restriction endonuclease subunit S [uncultured Desulfobacter sp.]